MVLNEQLTEIGESAFVGCVELSSVTFNKQLRKIENTAFANCRKLTVVSFKEDLIEIGKDAFRDCAGLSLLILNEHLKQIGDRAFSKCVKLAQVTLNKELTRIGTYAFGGCTSLAAVTFNEQLTEVGSCAFGIRNNIKDIAIATTSEQVYDHIKELLPIALRKLCIEMSWFVQLLTIRTKALNPLLAEPRTNPIRRTAKNLSNFPSYIDFWRVLNQHMPECNPYCIKAKRLMDFLPWPTKNDEKGLAEYNEKCQKIVQDCLNKEKSGFFASLMNTSKSKTNGFSDQSAAEVTCKKINTGL